jgi:hypothetical protein
MSCRALVLSTCIAFAGIRPAAAQQVLLYSADSGIALTGRVNQIDGVFHSEYVYTDFRIGWTHITSAPGGRMFFYDSSSGSGATGFLDEQGAFTTLRRIEGLSLGWTHVVWAGHAADFSYDLFLFYNANTGAGATGSVDANGRFTTLRPLTFSSGWTHIAADPYGDELLFYNANTGDAATGFLDGSGQFNQQQTLDGFSTEWRYIGPADFWSNTLFFYNSDTGHAAIGRIRLSDGQFVTLREYEDFSPGWTDIGLAGNMLLFYYAGDGSTATGEFYDAQFDFHTLQYDDFGRNWTHMIAVGRM